MKNKKEKEELIEMIFKEIELTFNENIDGITEHRNSLQKDNTIYEKSSDELNEDFIANLKKLKYKIKLFWRKNK